eukprot:732034-Pyramimonas_sp.AAC.1
MSTDGHAEGKMSPRSLHATENDEAEWAHTFVVAILVHPSRCPCLAILCCVTASYASKQAVHNFPSSNKNPDSHPPPPARSSSSS